LVAPGEVKTVRLACGRWSSGKLSPGRKYLVYMVPMAGALEPVDMVRMAPYCWVLETVSFQCERFVKVILERRASLSLVLALVARKEIVGRHGHKDGYGGVDTVTRKGTRRAILIIFPDGRAEVDLVSLTSRRVRVAYNNTGHSDILW